MKEIINKLHENRQIELAKSILESAGYKVTKKSKRLNEGVEGDTIKSWVEELSTVTDFDLSLDAYRSSMKDGSELESSYMKECDIIAKWFALPETKIYLIDEVSAQENSIVGDIYNKLVHIKESDRTRLEHEDVDLEDDGLEYHSGLGLWKLNSTGELYVSGAAYHGETGEYLYYFCLADK